MKVKLKSKLGRPFWRFEKQLSPDDWTEFDLSDEQLAAIKPQCLMTVAQGGALDIEPNPWVKPVPTAAPAAPPKDQPKGK